MDKDFFALSGIIHHNYTEDIKQPLQDANSDYGLRDLYDVILWHNENGSYVSIQNRVSIENRSEAWITPEQALKLLDFLNEHKEKLQELCGKEKQQS